MPTCCIYLATWSLSDSREKNQHFARPPPVSWQNVIRGTLSAEISRWWPVTSQICQVLLIGWRPQLFKGWITLLSTNKSLSTGWSKYMESLLLIRWIVIYEGDSAIQSLNKWGQKYNPVLGSRHFSAYFSLFCGNTSGCIAKFCCFVLG